jgi:CelD/BcsL family acetyltransferase involved in cellulose biosynthesis
MSGLTSRFLDLDQLAARRAEWAWLAANALEPNPFYGPDLLLPALRLELDPHPTQLLAVERHGRLAGLFPLQRPFLRDGAMSLGWTLYRDALTCLTTPIIEREAPQEVLASALSHLAACVGPGALVLPILAAERPFARLLAEHGERNNHASRRLREWERPVILRGQSIGDELRKSIEKKRRKLEKSSVLDIIRVSSGDAELPKLLEFFLAIEMASWKGRGGTAIRNLPAMEAVVQAIATAREASPGMMIEALMIDGEPVAINLNLVVGGTIHTVKSTYNEAFAMHSPGRLLDSRAFDLVGPEIGAELVDSCAGPGHPLLDLWPHRQAMATFALALRPAGRLNLAGLALGGALSDHVRRWRYRETYTTRKTRRMAA